MDRRKAVIVDLDGTLFNSRKEVSDFNVFKVNECFDAGNIVIIATARPLRTVIRRLPQKMNISYLVLCNGASILKNGRIVNRDGMKAEEVKWICHQLANCGYKPAIEANDSFYTDGERDPSFEGHYFPINAYDGLDACKVLAYKAGGIDQNEIDRIISDEYTKVITDKGTLLQISKKSCTKVSACDEILRMERIDWKNTFAFGDDNNDIPVFEKAGFAIAMHNAAEELKNLSTQITESNDDDGVGKAIDKFILTKI
jgi:5-amino-6-(5-phospho-D-ribitylamino)uracil phosphatase